MDQVNMHATLDFILVLLFPYMLHQQRMSGGWLKFLLLSFAWQIMLTTVLFL